MVIPAISIFVVTLQQTAPVNTSVCPGQQLVYTCGTVSTGVLEWQLPGQQSVVFTISQDLNFIMDREQFTFQLIGLLKDGAVLISTATAEKASSSLDGLKIECNDGLNYSTLLVDMAG